MACVASISVVSAQRKVVLHSLTAGKLGWELNSGCFVLIPTFAQSRCREAASFTQKLQKRFFFIQARPWREGDLRKLGLWRIKPTFHVSFSLGWLCWIYGSRGCGCIQDASYNIWQKMRLVESWGHSVSWQNSLELLPLNLDPISD